MRNLSKQNRKKIFDLIKRDCTFVGSYDLEHSEESVLTYLPKPGTQIHKDVEEVRVIKNRKTGNWVESVGKFVHIYCVIVILATRSVW